MADTNHPIAALHWVTIDVARCWSAVLAEASSGQRHRFRMVNSAAYMQRLLDFLRGFDGRHWVDQPRFREAMFNSWDKNDPEDAAVILVDAPTGSPDAIS